MSNQKKKAYMRQGLGLQDMRSKSNDADENDVQQCEIVSLTIQPVQTKPRKCMKRQAISTR